MKIDSLSFKEPKSLLQNKNKVLKKAYVAKSAFFSIQFSAVDRFSSQ